MEASPAASSSDDIRTAGISSGSGGTTAMEFLEKNKTWFIVGVVIVLLLLALIQVIVTINRIKKKKQPASNSKERLVTNSGWKDYSRANLNYAYENFETEENGVNSRRMGGSNGGTTSMTRSSSSSHPHGRSNGNHHPRGNGGSPMRETRDPYHPGVDGGMAYSGGSGGGGGGGGYRNGGHTHASQHHHYSSQPSGLSIGDTRSLQRPQPSGGSRNGGDKTWSSSGAMSDPRATYSLPRGSHGMQAGYDRSAVVEDTPDFYYLPSQRKYTGEVIRVFVKHNQQK